MTKEQIIKVIEQIKKEINQKKPDHFDEIKIYFEMPYSGCFLLGTRFYVKATDLLSYAVFGNYETIDYPENLTPKKIKNTIYKLVKSIMNKKFYSKGLKELIKRRRVNIKDRGDINA